MAETFAEYRTRVLGYLGTRDPIRVQRATPAALEGRVRKLAPGVATRRPAPGKWSIAEIVAHLADAELAMGWRLRNMLATPGVALEWWDQDQWAARLGYTARPVGECAALFRALRTANLRLLAGVPRPWWDTCAGVHQVRGRQTVAEFVALEAAHDLNHLRQIGRILAHASGGRAAARRSAT
jgi:DinB family protein